MPALGNSLVYYYLIRCFSDSIKNEADPTEEMRKAESSKVKNYTW